MQPDGHGVTEGGYTFEEGMAAVRAARAVIDAAVLGEAKPPEVSLPERFRELGGVFTTIQTYPHGELRGCVGFAEPVLPLFRAIQATAVAAALADLRFPPLQPLELPVVTVGLSLLTRPQEIRVRRADEFPGRIEMGRHGLIVRENARGGLLLPQVALDLGWSAEEFLSQVCLKAGLAPERWREGDLRVLTFGAQIFKEEMPRGPVMRFEHPAGTKPPSNGNG